jgi:hypothetical protein
MSAWERCVVLITENVEGVTDSDSACVPGECIYIHGSYLSIYAFIIEVSLKGGIRRHIFSDPSHLHNSWRNVEADLTDIDGAHTGC